MLRILYFIFSLWLLAPAAQAQDAPEQSNGDSAFADNLLAGMNDVEYASYIHAFVAVMEKGKPHTTYQWNTSNAIGKIIAGENFVTKTHQHCRGFSESYNVGQGSQFITGIACRNEQKGWCKLRATSTPTCHLTHPGGIEGMILDTNIALDRLSNGATQMQNNFNSFKMNLP